MRLDVWCVQETLRIYPPVGIGQVREATCDVTLAGRLHLPKGTIVWVPHYGIQNAKHNWDRPDDFLPGPFPSDLLDSLQSRLTMHLL